MPRAKRPAACRWHCSEDEWYQRCVAHWSAMEDKDHDGVLGGYGAIDAEDAAGSLKFIDECVPGGASRSWRRALDCGAGVGRVTRDVLLHLAENVHLVEVSASLLDQAREQPALQTHAGRLEFTQVSLREFAPPPGAYDLVWAQWVLGHLTDHDVVQLLTRCTAALRPGGAVCVKDNTCTPSHCERGRKYHIDRQNAGVVRTHVHLRSLFRMAGLKLVRASGRCDFPDDIWDVRMYWLVPAS